MNILQYRKIPILLLLASVVAILVISAACRQVALEEVSDDDADSPAHSVELTGPGLAESASFFKNPTDVQELVNRADVVVVASIGTVSGTVQSEPADGDTTSLVEQGYPVPTLPETYYELVVEQVLLDDGVIGELRTNTESG